MSEERTLDAKACRCNGTGCTARANCLRYTDRDNGLAWTERLCEPGHESESFIAAKKQEIAA